MTFAGKHSQNKWRTRMIRLNKKLTAAGANVMKSIAFRSTPPPLVFLAMGCGQYRVSNNAKKFATGINLPRDYTHLRSEFIIDLPAPSIDP